MGVRTLAELIAVYHHTVGRNGFLMMDFAPTPAGLIAPAQAAAYAEFGQWLRGCYGTAIATAQGTVAQGGTLLLKLAHSTAVDRVVVQEDQRGGQRIRAYTVEVQGAGGWEKGSAGTSVGNKKIDLLAAAVNATALRLTVVQSVGPAVVRAFSVYHCG